MLYFFTHRFACVLVMTIILSFNFSYTFCTRLGTQGKIRMEHCVQKQSTALCNKYSKIAPGILWTTPLITGQDIY